MIGEQTNGFIIIGEGRNLSIKNMREGGDLQRCDVLNVKNKF